MPWSMWMNPHARAPKRDLHIAPGTCSGICPRQRRSSRPAASASHSRHGAVADHRCRTAPLPTTVEEVARTSAATTSSSSSRSSWTCTASRTRSSCPARTSTTCRRTAPGFAGFAAGDDRPAAATIPTSLAMPDVRSFTPLPWRPSVARLACDLHVEGEPWPYCPRTILRRQLERARAARLRVQDRRRARVLPRARSARTARSSSPTRSTRSTQPCYDMRALTRNLDFVTRGRAQRRRARLGQLRHRPRGRQRPVRAELRASPTR